MRIELQQVTVERRGRAILRGIDLALAPGRVTVLLGRSGSGLSTLLKVAAGLLAPTSGRVLYDSCDLARLDAEERRRLQTRTGFMFQDAALWANQTVAVNLDLPLRAKDPARPEADRRRQIEAALQQCAWEVDLAARPAQLAQGERKMLSFLRAAVPGPEALFLDEPLAGLDDAWRERLLANLADLRSRGATVAAAGQDHELIAEFADALAVLTEGRILAQGTPGEVAAIDDRRVEEFLRGRCPQRRTATMGHSRESSR